MRSANADDTRVIYLVGHSRLSKLAAVAIEFYQCQVILIHADTDVDADAIRQHVTAYASWQSLVDAATASAGVGADEEVAVAEETRVSVEHGKKAGK